VTLVIFENDSSYDIPLDPILNKTGDIWHIWVEGLKEGTCYGYRIDGPFDPRNGHRFNKNKLLLDPYARSITSEKKWDLSAARPSTHGAFAFSEVDSAPYVPKSIIMKRIEYTSKALNLPSEKSIIYEMHVKGFTFHKSSGVQYPGTYKGLIEKIPYLKELGITAVELLPIQEFDEFDNTNKNPETGSPLKNYWGYSTIAFFAPKASYAANKGSQLEEFLELVKAMHEAGIEVILDVVFNHTGEGDHLGPTLSFRGIDNSIYYMLDEEKQYYKNYSGCGNTFNCNHPFVRSFIMDCLRYWAVEVGVDGFRFDLAAILGRDQEGNILENSPIIELIEQDPILRHVKIIAEAWDAAGAYKVGDFPGRWREWNGQYRDDIRRFWRGDEGCTGHLATRLCGSADLYGDTKHKPCYSINFVTCHDGFTLNDLVSYNHKHNMLNGENNKDGEDYNISYNYGVEGPTDSADINALRLKQAKNFMATLLLSRGVPMITAGDEFLFTKNGNNNTYCQDNELSWIDWGLLEKNKGMFRFTKEMIALRKAHPVLHDNRFFHGSIIDGRFIPDISWYDAEGNDPDWNNDKLKLIIALINGKCGKEPDNDVCIIFNANYWDITCKIPPAPSGYLWELTIDTSSEEPLDIREPDKRETLWENYLKIQGFSTVVLISSKEKAPWQEPGNFVSFPAD